MSPIRILIFSHFSERDGTELLRCIAKCLQQSTIRLQHVIFTSYNERRDGRARIGKWLTAMTESTQANPSADRNLRNRFVPEVQQHYVETWKNLDPTATISSEQTIEEALDQARKLASLNTGIQALITGSLHLVSGALCLLRGNGPRHRLC